MAKNKTIVVAYRGNATDTRNQFVKDSEKHRKKYYFPVSENYTEGRWGIWMYLLALALCVVGIGVLMLLYMLITKPKKGTLTVTYEYREPDASKTCPSCAETVKEAASKCRHCGYEF